MRKRENFQLGRFERLLLLLFPEFLLQRILPRFTRFDFFDQTRDTQTAIDFSRWYFQMVRGHCSDAYWPVHKTSHVGYPNNILCGVETSPGFSPGNYIQAIGKIYVGDYTQIAPNVGIISANHDLYDNRKHLPSEVRIGKYCWIGFGAVILPNVELGDFTVVGAGAVVTKSFPQGYCVIAGNPARVVRELDPAQCVRHRSANEYNGYIPAEKFASYRKAHLSV